VLRELNAGEILPTQGSSPSQVAGWIPFLAISKRGLHKPKPTGGVLQPCGQNVGISASEAGGALFRDAIPSLANPTRLKLRVNLIWTRLSDFYTHFDPLYRLTLVLLSTLTTVPWQITEMSLNTGSLGSNDVKSTVAMDTSVVAESTETERSRDEGRPVRECRINPTNPPLTEESLLQLERSQPNYRLSQRNLSHWFFYIQSTVQDSFDTAAGFTDPDYYSISDHSSILSLSQADTWETHHTFASSTDLFGLVPRSPPPQLQVVLQSHSRVTSSPESLVSETSSDSSLSSLLTDHFHTETSPVLPPPSLQLPPALLQQSPLSSSPTRTPPIQTFTELLSQLSSSDSVLQYLQDPPPNASTALAPTSSTSSLFGDPQYNPDAESSEASVIHSSSPSQSPSRFILEPETTSIPIVSNRRLRRRNRAKQRKQQPPPEAQVIHLDSS